MPAAGLPFLCVCPCPFVLQTKPLLSTRTLPCLCLPSAAMSLILIGLHFPQCCCNAATKPVTPRPAPSSPLWRQQPPRPSPCLTNFFLPHIFSSPVHPTASASFALPPPPVQLQAMPLRHFYVCQQSALVCRQATHAANKLTCRAAKLLVSFGCRLQQLTCYKCSTIEIKAKRDGTPHACMSASLAVCA